MDGAPEWLPELELFSDYGGDWEQYLDAIYQIFCQDFVDSKPLLRSDLQLVLLIRKYLM